jgi:hypothetical protein
MPERPDKWRAYLEAATRKADIAAYHAAQLKVAVSSTQNQGGALPPIPVQAHFEGLVVSAMAAVDQVAQAVNSALRMHLDQSQLVQRAFDELGRRVPEIKAWFQHPLGRDLRRLRTRMIHYSYAKTPDGPSWCVESVDSEYVDCRELVAYAESSAEYVGRLSHLFPKVKALCSAGTQR